MRKRPGETDLLLAFSARPALMFLLANRFVGITVTTSSTGTAVAPRRAVFLPRER
jgi:hypothetical protein